MKQPGKVKNKMAELKVGCIVMGILENNVYFVHREGEYDAVIIDPNSQGGNLFTKLREKGLTVKGILLTHGHFDHIMGVNDLKEISGATIYASEDEENLLGDSMLNSSAKVGKNYTVKPDVLLKEGDVVEVGSMKFTILKTPGHTEGSCCYYCKDEGILFSGDTLFCESAGRTDFETGNTAQLKESLKKLMKLPEDVKVYPGHGDFTTIAHEQLYNPFIGI